MRSHYAEPELSLHRRNGTIKSIREIIHNLNEAKLDPDVGVCLLIHSSHTTRPLTPATHSKPLVHSATPRTDERAMDDKLTPFLCTPQKS